jgi:hypothetical protein
MMRQCGDCQLCCKLLPVPPLGKKAGQRCQYQRHGKGCTVYHSKKMPGECALWNCRWLVNDDAADLARPDRSHYVIDLLPDYITLSEDATGKTFTVQVVQIWIDPDFPDAHRDPALRRYIERRAGEGIAALVRFNARDALAIFAPAMSTDGQWHEKAGVGGPDHKRPDIETALGGKMRMVIE